MKKARLYARVSTVEQKKKNISIPVQIASLKEYCKNNQFTVINTYIDNGISASSITKRKSFLKMIEESNEGDYILFTRLDK
jgi:DNA invertase Pin-like site-specific DNA recombinase